MRTEGIILKRQNMNEHDIALVFYTRESGKIKAIAKSALKRTSIQGMHLDVFNLAEFELIEAKAMPIVAGAQSQKCFSGIKNSLARNALAYFFIETIDKIVPENEKDPALWEFLNATLMELDTAEDGMLLHKFRERQLGLLEVLGYFPEIESVNGILAHSKELGQLFEIYAGRKINSLDLISGNC
jgi:DNA repair protein RecO (recombination protein O)